MNALNREHNLQQELRDLRLAYEQLLTNYELLQKEHVAQQENFALTEKKITLDYDGKLRALNEELFVVRNKLELAEKDRKIALDLKSKQFTVSMVHNRTPKEFPSIVP